MKHLSSLAVIIAATFICVQSASAENLGTVCSEYKYSAASDSSDSSSSSTRLKSSFELDYNFVDVENFNDFGATFVFGGLVLTGTYGYYNELPDGCSNYATWSAGAGLNKRIYLLNFLFVEGRIVADYLSYASEYDGQDPVTGGEWGCYGKVRAGLKLFSNTCVIAGYKWRFDQFKFTEDYMTEQFSVGLSFLF